MSDPIQKFPPNRGLAATLRSRLRPLLIPVVILLVGYGISRYFVATAPTAERKQPVRQARLVDVVRVKRADVRVRVQALGPVIAAQEVELKSQVDGEIVEVSDEWIPGGLLAAGTQIVRIEPRDYELAVSQRRSEVAAAERDLKLERGQQLVAAREFELLGEVIGSEDRELVLRQPQLTSAKHRLDAAKAMLEDAQLDVARTQVRAPFNAFLREKNVDLGEIVTSQTPLATLVGTDQFWIEVSVPVDDLRWIDIPRKHGDQGSRVRIFNETAWGPQIYRTGRVARLAGNVETQGRMARVIVAVDDPMSVHPDNVEKPVLLLGSYVRTEIEGRSVPEVVPLERSLLHDGNRVWVVGKDDGLETRDVEIAYHGRDRVLIRSGLQDGERVVTTDLAAPVPGIPLRVGEERPLLITEDRAFLSEPNQKPRQEAKPSEDRPNPS